MGLPFTHAVASPSVVGRPHSVAAEFPNQASQKAGSGGYLFLKTKILCLTKLKSASQFS